MIAWAFWSAAIFAVWLWARPRRSALCRRDDRFARRHRYM